MNLWWLAIAREHASYHELRARKVLAQGWPQLGDLGNLVRLAASPSGKDEFLQAIGELVAETCGDGSEELSRAPRVMWNLLRVEKDDLVVGIEGMTVRGLAQASASGWRSYEYDTRHHYAQSIAHPTEWHDWDDSLGIRPSAPSRLLGVKGLQADKALVIEAWRRVTS